MVSTVVLYVLWAASGWAFNIVVKRFMREVAALKRENGILAKALKAHSERIEGAEKDSGQALEIALDCQKGFMAEPAKPKLVAKPQRANWKQFRTAAEKANDPKEEE